MSETALYIIPLPQLALTLILVGLVAVIYFRWSLKTVSVLYATARMIIQLLLIGLFLNLLFDHAHPVSTALVLVVMMIAASWIALRPVIEKRNELWKHVFLAISLGGSFVLVFITTLVLRPSPWFEPRYILPLGGMIFANAMNSVSLAAERFTSDKAQGKNYVESRNSAFGASLIPITNTFFAVGIVAFPGIMTGQILAGVSPLTAVRYQIMVLCMIFGACGLSSAIFLRLIRGKLG